MPTRWNERARRACLVVALILSSACKKEEEPEEDTPPPSPGGASADLVATEIGSGRGLPSHLAATSAEWRDVFVIDDDTAIVAGQAQNDAVALRTSDGGRSWSALRTAADPWLRWSAGSDGSVVLLSGKPAKVTPRPGEEAPLESARLWFATADGSLSQPAPFFPDASALAGLSFPPGGVAPAVLSPDLGSVVMNRGRVPVVAFAAPAGTKAPPVIAASAATLIAIPYGRPPQLLSVSTTAVQAQPWPKAGAGIGAGTPIQGLKVERDTAQRLARGPSCHAGAWSFQRLAPSSPAQPATVVAVSDTRAVAFSVPPGSSDHLGCSAEAVTVEIALEDDNRVPAASAASAARPKRTQLVRCTLDGKCSQPQSPPYEEWPEPHERNLVSAPTKDGLVAFVARRAGTRWSLTLAQSTDAGKTFELPRVIGEGKTERGNFQIGAVINFPNRVVLLMAADRTGTSSRGWYVLASDDGGATWGPP
jgi:hypothetical protein